jgi:hypothetical protein
LFWDAGCEHAWTGDTATNAVPCWPASLTTTASLVDDPTAKCVDYSQLLLSYEHYPRPASLRQPAVHESSQSNSTRDSPPSTPTSGPTWTSTCVAHVLLAPRHKASYPLTLRSSLVCSLWHNHRRPAIFPSADHRPAAVSFYAVNPNIFDLFTTPVRARRSTAREFPR